MTRFGRAAEHGRVKAADCGFTYTVLLSPSPVWQLSGTSVKLHARQTTRFRFQLLKIKAADNSVTSVWTSKLNTPMDVNMSTTYRYKETRLLISITTESHMRMRIDSTTKAFWFGPPAEPAPPVLTTYCPCSSFVHCTSDTTMSFLTDEQESKNITVLTSNVQKCRTVSHKLIVSNVKAMLSMLYASKRKCKKIIWNNMK